MLLSRALFIVVGVFCSAYALPQRSRSCEQEGYTRCPGRDQCIRNAWFCDGDNDCGDNSDENPAFCASVPLNCESDQFKCPNRPRCIPRSYLCDGDNDCRDNSDENPDVCRSSTTESAVTATPCGESRSRCPGGGRCISNRWFCDGDNDCGDNSDEQPSTCASIQITCPPYHAKCRNKPWCIPETWFCDGDNDCRDDSDEEQCEQHRTTLLPAVTSLENLPEQQHPTLPPAVTCLENVQSRCIMPLQAALGGLDLATIREKIASTNLREICRPIIPFPQCVRNTLHDGCDAEARATFEMILPVYETVIDYVCVQNVEVFEAHKQCLMGESEGETAADNIYEQCHHLQVSSSRCPSSSVVDCGVGILRNQCGTEIAEHVRTLATTILSEMGCQAEYNTYKRGAKRTTWNSGHLFLKKMTGLFH